MQRLAGAAAAAHAAWAACPMMGGGGPLPEGHPMPQDAPEAGVYRDALDKVDWKAVERDIQEVLTTSQEHWPADWGPDAPPPDGPAQANYGPFMVRLAWHCTGSYRSSDGRGGCAGGRQRFEPERSWPDNTNLDKARTLLAPIKDKHGLGLSWGDLFTFAGTTAIKSMGGPTLGFCAGRIDEWDGAWSEGLGASPIQEELWPCPINGQCANSSGLGATTVGLIYVNPEGPMGNPLPAESAQQTRDTFGRMGMNDSETVALIGGGHAFGKGHGACPDGPGPSPKEDPAHPWPGMCGTGRGRDAVTAGFEGPWTVRPTEWDNKYFVALAAYDWQKHKGPGGHWQWRALDKKTGQPPAGPYSKVMMLTSDVGLLHDPEYKKLVHYYAENPKALDEAFSHAWYKLMTRDMGPPSRCRGPMVPQPQQWQHPLPQAAGRLADFEAVEREIRSEVIRGDAARRGQLVQLAFACAWTFRVTDYTGGCNGARIRHAPGKDWAINRGADSALALLEPLKAKHGSSLSWADLIVLAGTVGLTEAGADAAGFCGGRADAEDGDAWAHLEPRINGSTKSINLFKDFWKVMGMSKAEAALLMQVAPTRSGHVEGISAAYFRDVLAEKPDLSSADMILNFDPEFKAVVHAYVADEEQLKADTSKAWTKLVGADLFGPGPYSCMTVGAGAGAHPAAQILAV